MKNLSNDEIVEARTRSIVWDFLHVNKLIDPDDFSIELSEKILMELRESRLTAESLLGVIDKAKTAFFKVNSISKRRFADLLVAEIGKKLTYVALGAKGSASRKQSAPIKILFLSANPKNTETLRLDEEFREIESKILQSKERDKLRLLKKGAVRVGDLQFYLNQEAPNIVHFSGHGTEDGKIVLEDNNGNARAVSSKALERLFDVLKDQIRCVVLNACFSRSQALGISKHIDCVVGMSSSISDKAAIAFSTAFYLAIASKKSVKNAFDQGVTELLLWDIKEEDTPILISRKGVKPSQLFLLSP